MRGSWSISLLSFFRLRTVVVVGSLYWARSRLQPSTFRILFPTYLESVPPHSWSIHSSKYLYEVSIRGSICEVSIRGPGAALPGASAEARLVATSGVGVRHFLQSFEDRLVVFFSYFVFLSPSHKDIFFRSFQNHSLQTLKID